MSSNGLWRKICANIGHKISKFPLKVTGLVIVGSAVIFRSVPWEHDRWFSVLNILFSRCSHWKISLSKQTHRHMCDVYSLAFVGCIERTQCDLYNEGVTEGCAEQKEKWKFHNGNGSRCKFSQVKGEWSERYSCYKMLSVHNLKLLFNISYWLISI